MTRWGKVDCRQMKNLQDRLQGMGDMRDTFYEAAAKELAARLLAKVIERTPVGQYPSESGMKGGTLRRGWTPVSDLNIRREGDSYVIDVVNPVEYASYVEYGHRTRGGGRWIEGRFMLTVSVDEVQSIAPKLLEKKLAKWLKEVLDGK